MGKREEQMARDREAQLKPLYDKLGELDRQIEEASRRLAEANASKRALQDVLAAMTGDTSHLPAALERKPRASNVKGVVLDIMANAGTAGRTSAEVVVDAGEIIPGIARDTVSSVLSRLKTAGALVYDGLRYYDVKHGPKDGETRTAPHMRAV